MCKSAGNAAERGASGGLVGGVGGVAGHGLHTATLNCCNFTYSYNVDKAANKNIF